MPTPGARSYDPAQRYEVRVRDVEYRRDESGSWLVRVYQPQGPGPFPALVDVHGGAWNLGDRGQNVLIDRDLAASGLVVAALDFRLAPKHPYPAQVTDVNYGTRWLKAHAGDFNADPGSVGGLGTSSGGHTVMLSAMRPRDPRYAALPLAEAQGADATLRYILALWAVLDPYARYLYAKEAGRQDLVAHSEAYWLTREAMQEGNPQLILERAEEAELPPTLMIQPVPDANIPRSIPERFVESFGAAGGSIDIEWFPGMPHGFAREPGPETDRALALMKAFVAQQVAGRVVPA